jgi:hypothetical protein
MPKGLVADFASDNLTEAVSFADYAGSEAKQLNIRFHTGSENPFFSQVWCKVEYVMPQRAFSPNTNPGKWRGMKT